MQTIARLYENYSDAAATVRDLEKAGIAHADISLIANEAAATEIATENADPDVTPEGAGAGTGEAFGAIIGGGAGLLAGLGLLAIPGIGPVVAAGWLVATITGAGVGAAAGSLLGALVGAGISAEHVDLFTESIRRGGALVSVRVGDAGAAKVENILQSHNPIDPIAQEELLRATGWAPFGP